MAGEFDPVYAHVGITASRHGLSASQTVALRLLLADLQHRYGAHVFHHGDCIGGDHDGALLAKQYGFHVVGHPPTDDRLRCWFPSDETRPARNYLARDRDIVTESHVLLAFPGTDFEQVRSGTWFTIRCARKQKLPRIVIGPSGRVLEEVGIGGLWESAPGEDGGAA